MTTTDADRGASPVIGVILMVAITVILAATVGTFVLDTAGSVEETANAGATATFDTADEEIVVRFTSNQNADRLNVSITNGSTGETMYFDLGAVGSQVTVAPDGNSTVGAVTDGPGAFVARGGHSYTVVVTAMNGGTGTVVLSKTDDL